MKRQKERTLYSLQIGRALAAIAVVMHHANTATQHFFPGIPAALFDWLHLGYLGVDYFFVLSGFIIAHSTMQLKANRAGAKHYALSRGIRIYIPYLPISLAMVVILVLLPSISQGVRGNVSVLASLFLLPMNAPTALSVAWTLQHEMMFYLLYGICFFWLRNGALIFLWALPIAAAQFFHFPRWVSFPLGLINIEFLFGVAICTLYHHNKFFALRHVLVAFGAALIAICCVVILHDDTLIYYGRLIGFGFACVVLGVAYMERTTDFSKYRTLLLLGSASYAIYLVHGPFISVLMRVLPLVPHWSLALLLCIALSCAAGVFYYRCIETPLSQIAKNRWMRR